MKELHSRDVCELMCVSQRQIDIYCNAGLIAPSVKAANGHGSSRVWSENDLVHIMVVRALLDAGFSVQRCVTALQTLRADQTGGRWLCTNGEQAVIHDTDLRSEANWAAVWTVVIDLEKARAAVSEVLAAQAKAEP